MDFELPTGKYVVAVSGGVDSMVLLDLLAKKSKSTSNYQFVVAHFNHGIRPDSHLDEKLVKSVAVNKYNLPVEIDYGNLGQKASEDLARRKRYEFLESVRAKHQADGIITAHHQDDLLETAFLNILRGSGYRGLTSMQRNKRIRRPLLNVPKKALIQYAKAGGLEWREDKTNKDTRYLRNYIREQLMPALKDSERQSLINSIERIVKTHSERDKLIADLSQKLMEDGKIDRGKFAALPSEIANELLMHWLRLQKIRQFDRQTIERLNIFLRTGVPGAVSPVRGDLWLRLQGKGAQFIHK